MLARAAAERSNKKSSKMARKAFKNNWRQGEIHATFVPFVRVSTLEIRNKKLVVSISKSHSRNEAQIGIKSATHVQLTQQIQVIAVLLRLRKSLLSRGLPGAAALRSRGSLDRGSRAVAPATFPVAFALVRSRRIASIFCRARLVHIFCCA